MVKLSFKNKTAGFYVGIAAAIFMLISDILYIALDFGDRTFSYLTFFLIMAAAVIDILMYIIDKPVLDAASVITCAMYGVGFGKLLHLVLPTLSDVWNGVNFVGGNPKSAVLFSALFFIGTIAAIASRFMQQRKLF